MPPVLVFISQIFSSFAERRLFKRIDSIFCAGMKKVRQETLYTTIILIWVIFDENWLV